MYWNKILLAFLVMFFMSMEICFAMTFSKPVEVGGIGSPVQSPYRYYLIDGVSYNSGKPYTEKPSHASPKTTYKEGIAVFGNGEKALYCQYVHALPSAQSDDWKYAFKFGGKNNYVIAIDSQCKKIYKIDTNEGLTLYLITKNSGSERINVIGRQKDGKWVSYIDSKKLSQMYFEGKEAYKDNDGVHYDSPQVKSDSIVIPYKFQLKHNMINSGEFRFKWDDAAQWFGIEKVDY